MNVRGARLIYGLVVAFFVLVHVLLSFHARSKILLKFDRARARTAHFHRDLASTPTSADVFLRLRDAWI